MNIFTDLFRYAGSIRRWLMHYVHAHKVISTVVAILIVGGGWYMYAHAGSASAQTRYVLGTVSSSTIISVVSESGQVSASDTLDIKPQASGQILSVRVKAGDKVAAGQVLATVDSANALQSYNSAKLDLQQAQLTLKQDTSQAPIDFQKTQQSLSQAQQSLTDEYDDAYTTIANIFTTLPASITAADDLIHGNELSPTYTNTGIYQGYFTNSSAQITGTMTLSAQKAESDYTAARASYNKTYSDYKALSRSSSPAQIEAMLGELYATAKLVSQSVNSDVNLIDTTVDLLTQEKSAISSGVTAQQSAAHSDLNSVNSLLSQLSGEVKTIQTDKQNVVDAQQALQLASIDNPSGNTPISLQTDQNNVAKSQQALDTAAQTLADYTVRAPFAGTVASVSANVGDSASSGTALMTLITTTQQATLSLNEVDAAKVSLGQKATLTFDALPDLTLTGTVAEVDPVGTVSQGVVSYAVTVQFDAQNASVKPGMTVNADIQSGIAQDVLAVPQSAVKTTAGQSYVLVFNPPLTDTGGTLAGQAQGVVSNVAPEQVPVTTGLSDDTNIEILSGLTLGEQIVTRTSSGTATAATAARTTTGTTGAGAARGGAAGGFGGGANATFRAL